MFGGIKTHLNGWLRELREKTGLKRTLLETICYNLRILITLILLSLFRLWVFSPHKTLFVFYL